MSESLDEIHGKIDKIESIIGKKTVQDQISLRKEDSVTNARFWPQMDASMFAATHAGLPAALKEILLKGTLKEVERKSQDRDPLDYWGFSSEQPPDLWCHEHRHGLPQDCHGICTQWYPP